MKALETPYRDQPRWWKDIQVKRQREWRRANRERHNAQVRKRVHGTVNGYFTRKMVTLRNNAGRRRGIEITITADDLRRLYKKQKGLCALSGVEMVLTNRLAKAGPNALSVDRIRHDEGYVPTNIRLVTWRANAARGLGSDDELREFCRQVLALR